MSDDLRAWIEARWAEAWGAYCDSLPGAKEPVGRRRAIKRERRRSFDAGFDAALAARPVQDEVTFKTNLLDPVWLTTSSSRYTTRPVPAPVQDEGLK